MQDKVWLCGDRDGDSDGRVLFASNESPRLLDVDKSAYCPMCDYPKSYHGCQWVMLIEEVPKAQTDREALVAALDDWEITFAGNTTQVVVSRKTRDLLRAAARERLALLPETCGHGESNYHLIDGLIERGSCPGKVYPAETVETIGTVTTDPRWSHIESPWLLEFALAVLDALNIGHKPIEALVPGIDFRVDD